MSTANLVRKTTWACVLIAWAAAGVWAAGYLKLDGVEGETTDKDHKAWIGLDSVTLDPTEATAATGKRQHRPFTLVKSVDKASPKLAEAVAQGKTFPRVVLHIWDGAPDPSQPYLRYELKNVIVTSLTTGGHGDDRPTETLSLNDEEIKVQTVRPGVRPPVIPPLPRVPPPAPGRAGGR